MPSPAKSVAVTVAKAAVEAVDVNGLTPTGHSQTLLLLKRANRFFPIIEPILKEKGAR